MKVNESTAVNIRAIVTWSDVFAVRAKAAGDVATATQALIDELKAHAQLLSFDLLDDCIVSPNDNHLIDVD